MPAFDLESLFMQAPALICVLRGPDHVFDLVNVRYQQLVGARKLQGKAIREALPELEHQGFFEVLDSVYKTGKPFIGTEVPAMLDRSGTGRLEEGFFNFVYQPMYVDDAIAGVAVFGFEVTEHVRARREANKLAEELKKADRAKDEFIAIISHELRTPMTSILGWARMLELGGLDPRTHQEAIDAITRSTRAQAQLIEDLLDESRIHSGKLRLEMRPLDVNAVVDSVIASMRPSAEIRKISITFEPCREPVRIAGDPLRMQQVIGNVLSNAIKFTAEGGRIALRVMRDKENALIEVSDNGRGMSESLIPYVFDRFRQGGNTGSERQGGLGLGLAIARHLVEMHDGTIEASSRGEGLGSTFTIRLPLHETPAAEYSERDIGRARTFPQLHAVRVLIIEDEIDNRTVLSTVMKQCGAEVQCVGTATAAAPLIATWKPHVVIADIALPDLDGCTFMERLRSGSPAEGADTPALALTVMSRPDERARIRAAGFDVFRQKPIDPVDLAYVVARLAASRSHQHPIVM